MDIIIWAAIMIMAGIIELMSPALLSIWFVVGAGISLIMAIFGLPIWLQIVSFVIISTILFGLAWEFIYKKRKTEKTNTSAMVGKRATVTETIDYSTNKGQVQVNGQHWKAIPKNTEKPIKKGTVVTVVDVQNTSLIVEEESEN